MDWVNWISQFAYGPLVIIGFFTVFFGGGWLSDNAGNRGTPYEHKMWPRSRTIGAFLVGPAVGLLVAGVNMAVESSHHSFNLDHWLTAVGFIALASWLFLRYCRVFFTDHSTSPEVERLLREDSQRASLLNSGP